MSHSQKTEQPAFQEATQSNTVMGGNEWQQLAAANSAAEYYAAWLAIQCRMLPAVQSGVLVLGSPEENTYAPVAVWPPKSQPSTKLVEATGQTLESGQMTTSTTSTTTVLAVPVVIDQQLHGVFAVECSEIDQTISERTVQWMLISLFAIEAALRNQVSAEEQLTRERLIATLDLVASALSEPSFQRAAQVVATDLAIRLECDRVSIGFVRKENAEVVAVSHSADFTRQMNLIRAVGMAMDEALDQKSVVLYPSTTDMLLITRDHALLARNYGNENLLTIPFVVGNDQRGAFCFERPSALAFDAHAIELCQTVVAIVARIIEDKRRNDRLLAARIADSVAAQLHKLTGPRHFGRKIAATVFMMLVVFFSVATGNYRIGAVANLEGAVRRVLVAPFDGYVATSEQRAGDVVDANALLATLDDRDIRLEYLRWYSQLNQYARLYEESMAKHDRSQANIALAQVQQAEAQMNLAAAQLERTRIVAPFAGLVVSGDLSQSLGNTVKRGQVLFEVSPLDAYRVVLEVADSDVAAIAVGQVGELMLSALPGQAFPLKVTHLTPIVVAREGRSFFRVEALLGRQLPELRPGMEGVAKIEVGRRKLFWIWTHRLFDWLRLSFWSWM